MNWQEFDSGSIDFDRLKGNFDRVKDIFDSFRLIILERRKMGYERGDVSSSGDDIWQVERRSGSKLYLYFHGGILKGIDRG